MAKSNVPKKTAYVESDDDGVPQDTPNSQKLGWQSFSYRVVCELLPRLYSVAHSLPTVCEVLLRSDIDGGFLRVCIIL